MKFCVIIFPRENVSFGESNLIHIKQNRYFSLCLLSIININLRFNFICEFLYRLYLIPIKFRCVHNFMTFSYCIKALLLIILFLCYVV